MPLKPEPIGPIPQETVRVAKAACPKGSTFMNMRDVWEVLFDDSMFASLFPPDGQPALTRLPISSDHQYAICRGVIRSPGGGGGAHAYRLEICPGPGSG